MRITREKTGAKPGFGLVNDGSGWKVLPMPTDEYSRRPEEHQGHPVRNWDFTAGSLELIAARLNGK